jgi:DNA-binding PucR family transcriptional regulator
LAQALASGSRYQTSLSGIVSGDLVALVPDEVGPQLASMLLDFVDEFSRSRGEAAISRIAIAEPGPLLVAAQRLTDARHALSLATSLGIKDRVLTAPLISARMVLNRLAADSLAEKLVSEELAPLIEYDQRNDARLVETLQTYLLHGSSIQDTARSLHCSRQSMYRRKESIVRLIGPIDGPERHANLVVALELYALQDRLAPGPAS